MIGLQEMDTNNMQKIIIREIRQNEKPPKKYKEKL